MANESDESQESSSSFLEGKPQQPSEQLDRLAEPVGGEEGPRLPFPVVGICASAGGLEASIEFFKAVPDEETRGSMNEVVS
jgi:hypothetical protein